MISVKNEFAWQGWTLVPAGDGPGLCSALTTS